MPVDLRSEGSIDAEVADLIDMEGVIAGSEVIIVCAQVVNEPL